jgi:hypothetical protein
MDVFSEGHIVAVVKRWHATSCPLFGVDRQYVHFGSKCHSSKLSHGTKCRKDELCGLNCHVDVLRGGRIVKASATPLLGARTRMLDISNHKLQSHWGHVSGTLLPGMVWCVPGRLHGRLSCHCPLPHLITSSSVTYVQIFALLTGN